MRTINTVTTESCSVYVTLFHLTIVTLTAVPSVRYTLYPRPRARRATGPSGTRPSGHGGGQGGHRLQLCMVQLVDASPLTIYLSTKTIHKLQYLMGILMQVSWMNHPTIRNKVHLESNVKRYPPLHRSQHWMKPKVFPHPTTTKKFPATTKVPPQWIPQKGTFSWTPILIYTIIQLEQKKMSSRLFANKTPLQALWIRIPRLRAHPQSYPTEPRRTTPSVPIRSAHRSIPDATVSCSLHYVCFYHFPCVLYGLVVIWTSS